MLSDFRPIFVTPLLSHIVERIVVKKFLLPFLPTISLRDQFAYRPTCSTTACLVALEHYVAQYLESASFVRCLLIDYSKAFDQLSVISYKIYSARANFVIKRNRRRDQTRC